MMQKRTIYSLLLTSLFLVFAFTTAFGQEVVFESKTVARCQAGTMDITVDTPDDISGLEIVFEVAGDLSSFSVDWVLDAAFLPDRTIIVDGNIVRMYALEGAGDCLGSGATVVAQISFESGDVCEGSITVVGTEVAAPAPIPVVAVTQFTACSDAALVATTVTAGAITIANAAPVIAGIDDATGVDAVHFGSVYTGQATATDSDLDAIPGGCETQEFFKVGSDPAGLTVATDGSIEWTTTFADVCEHTVSVEVVDACGDADTTDFVICVYNVAPVITCPADQDGILGDLITGTITATDDEGSPLEFSEVSFDGPGDLVVNPDGTFEYQTTITEDYAGVGSWTATVSVTDNANTCDPCSPDNSDECTFVINVHYFQVVIEKVHDAYQGQVWPLNIDAFMSEEVGGFDLLIQYDASALLVYSVDPGAFVLPDGCGWEYFTYRYGVNGNCGPGACPSGVLRIVGIAETNNGDNYAGCLSTEGMANLAVINFLVSNDRTLECQYVPVRFVWYDCGDNALSSGTGDSLFISHEVFDYAWTNGWMPISGAADYPTLQGAQDVDCFILDPAKVPYRWVDFRNGGVDIPCADSIDARGDVNLNEIGYEVADAVLFSRYFVEGLGVFTVNEAGQIAATDVNADGIALSVADLVYLIRVVVGDALPYPKTVVPVNASYIHTNAGVVSVTDGVEMGAAFVVVEGNVEPELRANMDMRYSFDGVNTRILVYSTDNNTFSGEFLQTNGNIVSIEMATAEGNPVVAKLLPTEFALAQNYPNPFNPSTSIDFALPHAADYSLTIYNVNGQQVANIAGSADAGNHTIEWDASTLASGIYLYKLQVDGISIDTKKMVLLK